MDHAAHLQEYGYAVVRGAYSSADVGAIAAEMTRLKLESERYPATFRDRNLLYVITPDPLVGRNVQAVHWPAYVSPLLEEFRLARQQLALLGPILGKNLKQITNQVTWKMPGAASTAFGFHQDARFRRPKTAYRELATSFVQTLLAIDAHRVGNGCLKISPGSHKLGVLPFPVDESVRDQDYENASLSRYGLDPEAVIDIVLEPGDVAMWLPHTVHGSAPNLSGSDRRSYLNGYVIGKNSDRGEWAFRDGHPCKLGEPVLIQYDQLYERPEPHYVEGHIFPLV